MRQCRRRLWIVIIAPRPSRPPDAVAQEARLWVQVRSARRVRRNGSLLKRAFRSIDGPLTNTGVPALRAQHAVEHVDPRSTASRMSSRVPTPSGSAAFPRALRVGSSRTAPLLLARRRKPADRVAPGKQSRPLKASARRSRCTPPWTSRTATVRARVRSCCGAPSRGARGRGVESRSRGILGDSSTAIAMSAPIFCWTSIERSGVN